MPFETKSNCLKQLIKNLSFVPRLFAKQLVTILGIKTGWGHEPFRPLSLLQSCAYIVSIFNYKGLKSTIAVWHFLWKPLAFAVMPLELYAIYGHKWPTPFLVGPAVLLRYFSIIIAWGDSQIKNTNKILVPSGLSYCYVVYVPIPPYCIL